MFIKVPNYDDNGHTETLVSVNSISHTKAFTGSPGTIIVMSDGDLIRTTWSPERVIGAVEEALKNMPTLSDQLGVLSEAMYHLASIIRESGN